MRKPKRNIILRMSDVVPSQGSSFFVRSESIRRVPKQSPPLPQRVTQLGMHRFSDRAPYFVRSNYEPPAPKIVFAPDRPERMPSPVYQSPPARNNPVPRILTMRSSVLPNENKGDKTEAKDRFVSRQRSVAPASSRKFLSIQDAELRVNRKRFALKEKIRLSTRRFEIGLQEIFRRAIFAGKSLFRPRFAFAVAGSLMAFALLFGGNALLDKGMALKGEVLGVSRDGYESLNQAVDQVKLRRFDQSSVSFSRAVDSFRQASESFDEWNSLLIESTRFFPVLSKLSSGKYAMEAGEHIALAGKAVNDALSVASSLQNPLHSSEETSLLEVMREIVRHIEEAKKELVLAQEALDKVKSEDIPEDKREKFSLVRAQLPAVVDVMETASGSNKILTELLGGNGPRKYLFLFQNNHEMRATGGFIGSYGLLDISSGRVRNFFVDGIFNPDGQLKENIVPPKPIQKVSAAWSLHDSNWFPDFPTSAEKAIFFYEKTGGPTVDGVITLTPTVMQKLLRVTGPIRMDAYDKTLTADNFVEEVQQQVEVDYDKEENKPKQILADLAPILLDKLFSVDSAQAALATARAFEEGLNEKHILIYSRNADMENLLDEFGWSGRMLPFKKDFLSVVNTNINGYKTDGVIDESINHRASIQSDGSVLDTVTVTRKHVGGYTNKEWWNKVNADYMRVYVPLGSQLVSAEGQTREVVESPLDYDALGFRLDEDIEKEERSMTVDPNTGTLVYDEGGKTVFANWVYVSPQESVTITYTYLLPFTVDPNAASKEGFDSYSLLAQKQAGSKGDEFVSTVDFPSKLKNVWQSSENLLPYDGDKFEGKNALRFEGDLKRDLFLGTVFGSSVSRESEKSY